MCVWAIAENASQDNAARRAPLTHRIMNAAANAAAAAAVACFLIISDAAAGQRSKHDNKSGVRRRRRRRRRPRSRERERQEVRVLRAAVCMDRDVKPRSHHNN